MKTFTITEQQLKSLERGWDIKALVKKIKTQSLEKVLEEQRKISFVRGYELAEQQNRGNN